MRIRCISESLPQNMLTTQLQRFQGRWPVRVGTEYRVLELSQSQGLWYVTIENHEQEFPVCVPLAMFDVIEPSVSRWWNVRVKSNDISLRPVEFDEEYFYDDVQERRGDALERFRALKARMNHET